jgi:hypothetical protein
MNVILRDGMPLLYIAIVDLLYYLKSMIIVVVPRYAYLRMIDDRLERTNKQFQMTTICITSKPRIRSLSCWESVIPSSRWPWSTPKKLITVIVT